jgi:regulator of replication initiation timing
MGGEVAAHLIAGSFSQLSYDLQSTRQELQETRKELKKTFVELSDVKTEAAVLRERVNAVAVSREHLRRTVREVLVVQDPGDQVEALLRRRGQDRRPSVEVERPGEEREAFRALGSGAPVPQAGGAVRTAFVPIWRRPWMTMNRDTYGASVLARLGLTGLFDDADERYPAVELDQVAARHPDLVLLPSEPYPFRERHRADVAGLGAEVRLVDGQDLFWWGVRTPAAIDRLRQSVGA